jgi:prolyl 4-hydroxylase
MMSEVQQLVSAGQYAEAADKLMAAAAGGDPNAIFTLAKWRVGGTIVRRDLQAARDLLAKAAEAGHRQAALLHAHFVANGTGGPADWGGAHRLLSELGGTEPRATEQLDMLRRMAVEEDGEPARIPRLEALSQRPALFLARGFLEIEECNYLVRQAEPSLKPSVVTDRATGRAMLHPVRRSDGMLFGVDNEDLVVNAINRRIAAASGTKAAQAEPLQVLSYGPGGEFKPHVDSVKESGNQRILTALIYLTEDYEGGETKFLRTGLSFRGRTGDLLLFRNVMADGRPDLMTEHAGLPVTKGRKMIASRWIWRQAPQHAPPEPRVPNL